MTVVNGAQTAGSLEKALAQGRTGQLDAAKVMVRFISLESTGDAFATEVTRATNTQNRIGGRDFVSLDPEQRRIRDEFAVEGLQYVYRSGESDPDSPDRGCSIVQATVALACAGSAALATQAKREISRLWDDIGRAPYKQLFNASTSYLRIWRCVQVMRVVDTEISRISAALDGREKGIAVHGNRLVLHLVFRQLPLGEVENPGFNWDSALVGAKEIVPVTLAAVINVAEADYPGYPASLFKNATKVGELSAKALAAVGAAT